MKTKHIKLVTTLLSGIAFMTMPFQTLQATTAAEPDDLPGIGVQPDEYFFTGKPYDEDLGGVIFLYRNYDVETNRWMSSDPSGFPDGPNNYVLMGNSPTSSIDPDGLDFIHFDGTSMIHYNGDGYQSGGQIDWGSELTRWDAVSGSGTSASIPDGWYGTSGPMTLGGIEEAYYPERSVQEDDILFAGTMSSWDTTSGTGYGNYAFSAYGDAMRFGYDTSSGGNAPGIVEYKIGLAGIHGNDVSLSAGHRIHPTMAGATSGCIGITNYSDADSFHSFITGNIGMELLVE